MNERKRFQLAVADQRGRLHTQHTSPIGIAFRSIPMSFSDRCASNDSSASSIWTVDDLLYLPSMWSVLGTSPATAMCVFNPTLYAVLAGMMMSLQFLVGVMSLIEVLHSKSRAISWYFACQGLLQFINFTSLALSLSTHDYVFITWFLGVAGVAVWTVSFKLVIVFVVMTTLAERRVGEDRFSPLLSMLGGERLVRSAIAIDFISIVAMFGGSLGTAIRVVGYGDRESLLTSLLWRIHLAGILLEVVATSLFCLSSTRRFLWVIERLLQARARHQRELQQLPVGTGSSTTPRRSRRGPHGGAAGAENEAKMKEIVNRFRRFSIGVIMVMVISIFAFGAVIIFVPMFWFLMLCGYGIGLSCACLLFYLLTSPSRKRYYTRCVPCRSSLSRISSPVASKKTRKVENLLPQAVPQRPPPASPLVQQQMPTPSSSRVASNTSPENLIHQNQESQQQQQHAPPPSSPGRRMRTLNQFSFPFHHRSIYNSHEARSGTEGGGTASAVLPFPLGHAMSAFSSPPSTAGASAFQIASSASSGTSSGDPAPRPSNGEGEEVVVGGGGVQQGNIVTVIPPPPHPTPVDAGNGNENPPQTNRTSTPMNSSATGGLRMMVVPPPPGRDSERDRTRRARQQIRGWGLRRGGGTPQPEEPEDERIFVSSIFMSLLDASLEAEGEDEDDEEEEDVEVDF